MRWCAQSVAHSQNQAESVVALLAVLGSRTAEDLAPPMLITGGMMVWRPANVSSSVITCNCMTKAKLLLINAHIYVNNSSRDIGDCPARVPQMRDHREVWEKQLLWSGRFLVQTLWRCWEHKTSAHVVRRYPGLQITLTVQDSH